MLVSLDISRDDVNRKYREVVIENSTVVPQNYHDTAYHWQLRLEFHCFEDQRPQYKNNIYNEALKSLARPTRSIFLPSNLRISWFFCFDFET